MRHDHQGHDEHPADHGEIPGWVVGQRGVQAGVDAYGSAGAESDGMAVGRGIAALQHAGNAGAAGTVLDDDLLAPLLRERICEQARDDVRGLSGRKRHHQAHRF